VLQLLVHMTTTRSIIAGLAVALALCGCLSPERAVRDARRTGSDIAGEYMEKVTGRTNEFTIARPADRLRNRLLAEQGLDPALAAELNAETNAVNRPSLPDPLVLSLADALRAGAANSEEFQKEKESVFDAALALDLQRHAFENTFAGVLGGGWTSSDSSGGKSTSAVSAGAGVEGEAAGGIETGGGSTKSSQATGKTSASVSRKLSNGMTAAASLGIDVLKLLTGGSGRTIGISGDTSVTIPLLRGFGRDIVREPLTQAERNLLYAIYHFEGYRQSFAIKVATDYYGMLQTEQKLIALRDNRERLGENYKRAQMLYDAGRLSQVELDQTRQELLTTGDSLVDSERSHQAQLDNFKMSLGLPVDARVVLEMAELTKVTATMNLAETNSAGMPVQPALAWTEQEAVDIALTNSFEMIVERYRLDDVRRAVKIAADNLRYDPVLKGGIGYGKTQASGKTDANQVNYSLTLESNLPWDMREERNAYEAAVRAVDTAERAFAIKEDSTRQLIRDDIRSLNSAWNSYVIQSEALEVAARRVRSTTLFQQAGRSSTRDLLEAEAALLSARNSVVGAIVEYRMAGLKLRRDMSVLTITEEGLLLED
jgi:outer membrane protein TolC